MTDFLIILAVLAAVALFVTDPVRRARAARTSTAEPAAVAELLAARDAKYREIRDAELDRSTGKLSEADYEAVDQTLRAEAIEILHRLDEAEAESAAESPAATIPPR